MPLKVWNGSSWISATGLKVWNGSSWISGTGRVWNGSSWIEFFSPVTFTPAGGTSVGSPVTLSDSGQFSATVVISCSESATWTYSGGASGSSADIASGGSGTTITFSMSDLGGGPQSASYDVSATASGTTRYWTVTLDTSGDA